LARSSEEQVQIGDGKVPGGGEGTAEEFPCLRTWLQPEGHIKRWLAGPAADNACVRRSGLANNPIDPLLLWLEAGLEEAKDPRGRQATAPPPRVPRQKRVHRPRPDAPASTGLVLTRPPGPHHPGLHAAAALRNPWFCFEASRIVSLTAASYLTEETLNGIFDAVLRGSSFARDRVSCRSTLTLEGVDDVKMHTHYTELRPVVCVMLALAERTLEPGEELAVIQVVVSISMSWGKEVKRQRHDCRHICVTLGGPRVVEVWPGERYRMDFGDALALAGEYYAMPRDQESTGPRITVSIFYGSRDEWLRGDLSAKQQFAAAPLQLGT